MKAFSIQRVVSGKTKKKSIKSIHAQSLFLPGLSTLTERNYHRLLTAARNFTESSKRTPFFPFSLLEKNIFTILEKQKHNETSNFKTRLKSSTELSYIALSQYPSL